MLNVDVNVNVFKMTYLKRRNIKKNINNDRK